MIFLPTSFGVCVLFLFSFNAGIIYGLINNVARCCRTYRRLLINGTNLFLIIEQLSPRIFVGSWKLFCSQSDPKSNFPEYFNLRLIFFTWKFHEKYSLPKQNVFSFERLLSGCVWVAVHHWMLNSKHRSCGLQLQRSNAFPHKVVSIAKARPELGLTETRKSAINRFWADPFGKSYKLSSNFMFKAVKSGFYSSR